MDPAKRMPIASPVATRRGVIDEHLLTTRVMDRVAALNYIPRGILHHLILYANVGERTAHHHLVMPAPRAILVEVDNADLMLLQICSGGRRGAYTAGRGNVISRYRIQK